MFGKNTKIGASQMEIQSCVKTLFTNEKYNSCTYTYTLFRVLNTRTVKLCGVCIILILPKIKNILKF